LFVFGYLLLWLDDDDDENYENLFAFALPVSKFVWGKNLGWAGESSGQTDQTTLNDMPLRNVACRKAFPRPAAGSWFRIPLSRAEDVTPPHPPPHSRHWVVGFNVHPFNSSLQTVLKLTPSFIHNEYIYIYIYIYATYSSFPASKHCTPELAPL
jgi:hypothetical protein